MDNLEYITTVLSKIVDERIDQNKSALSLLGLFYETIIGKAPHIYNSSILIISEYSDLINENLIDNIQDMITQNGFLIDTIKSRYGKNIFYQQSVVLFVYWMLKKKRMRSFNCSANKRKKLRTDKKHR